MRPMQKFPLLLLSLLVLGYVLAAASVSSARPPEASPKFRYNHLDLATLPAIHEPSVAASSSDSKQLTLMQVTDCLQRLESDCKRAGFDDLFRVSGLDKDSSASTEGMQPELETRLENLLRLALFQAHRSDRPNERLAVCLLVQTPDIFDQWRPRSDPICLTLLGANFRSETSTPRAQSILCSPGQTAYSRVFAVCSRPAGVDEEIPRSTEPVVVSGQQQRPRRPVKGLAATTTETGSISRIVCALVWALTIALSIVAMLVAGALLNAELRRRRGLGSGMGVGISENVVAPTGDEVSSKGSLIVVTATAAEVAGMSSSVRLRDFDDIDYDDCPAASSVDEDYNDDEIQTQESDPCGALQSSSIESRL